MRRPSRKAIVLVGALAVVLALVATALPPDLRGAMARTVVVGAGIAAAAIYLRRSGPATLSTPERFELELRRAAEPRPAVAGLRAVEMAVRLSTASAVDFDVRLRPMLRDLARWRLLTGRGVDMDRNAEAARRIMGQPLASLVDGAGAPTTFGAPGVPLSELNAGLDQLEQI
ncbi:MAG: hypothetical protein ABI620_02745 [Chloroflexota bacterium]